MKRIVVSQKINPKGLEVFGADYDIVYPEGFTQEAFDTEVLTADAIVLRTNLKVKGEIIRAAKNLKVISRTGAGVDNVDLQAAKESGVIVCNLPALNNIAVAEHTVAMLMTMAKSMPLLDSAVRNGTWAKTRNLNKPLELRGKTLGVVGLGAIGAEVARICSMGLGMKILAYDPYAAPDKFKGYIETSDLMRVARESDFVTLHVPGMPATKGMINADFFAAMKPEAILVNCARGMLIDEPALIKTLKAGKIAGAAMDAFIDEPLPEGHPLLTMDNVLLTPHAGALTKETVIRAAVEACSQVKDVLEGRTPPYALKIK
ncbi:MAG: hydroxyacid dehydrogenase [Oscillospiraceae bacterium]